MLSSSTPDLREGSTAPVSVSSLVGHFGVVRPGSDKQPHTGTIKDVIPRPVSAPATKFSDCDSAFEGGGDVVDPAGDLGDIFTVLSIDEDPTQPEAHQLTIRDEDSTLLQPDAELGTDSGTKDRNQSETATSYLDVTRSLIPAIAEVSGEESDCSYKGNHSPNPPQRTFGDPQRSAFQAQQLSADKASVGSRPRQLRNLMAPQVCVFTSDDTSSDSNDEATQFSLPAMRRNSGWYRRRHSLASTTPDQITRMLLSHRRGSSSGPPIPCADCFQKMICRPSSHVSKLLEKQRSAEGDKYNRPDCPSFSATARPHRPTGIQPFPHQAAQSHHEPSGAKPSSSRSKSPLRMVKPRDASPSSSVPFHPVSLQPVSTARGSDSLQGITTPRPVSPRAVHPLSPDSLSPTSHSSRPKSPRPRSPGIVRQRPLSPRDEIEMILSQTPQKTPPRSPSPRLPSSSPTSSMFFPISLQERSRSPTSNSMSTNHRNSSATQTHQRTRSRSPRPGNDWHSGKLSRGISSSIDVGEPESTRSELTKPTTSLGPNFHALVKRSRSRSRSPMPHLLKPDRGNSRSSSPRPSRPRSPRPSGHDRRSSRRRSSLADLANKAADLSVLAGGSLHCWPSQTARGPDDSDDGNVDRERISIDRRRRRGSRGKILPSAGVGQKLPGLAARQSRRSSISIAHPTQEGTTTLGPEERADIMAKLAKRARRRSSWACIGEPVLMMTPVSSLTLLRENNNNVEEESELTKDPYALTLHFITDPGQSHPLRKILRPLIESIVPKLKLFNFVERSESAASDRSVESGSGALDQDRPARVPTLGVVLLLQEEFGMERILEAQKYLGSEPWELHHRGKMGSKNVPYPTNNQDFYAHQSRQDAALWAVRQVHFGKDRLRFQLFVSDEMWADSISFYSLLLSRPTHMEKADFCYFLVFCSQSLNLEVQLALKKLPPEFKPKFLDSTILQFKVGDMGQLVPLLPRVCIPISDKRWQTADPDGNKVLLFRDSDSCGTPVTPTTPDSSELTRDGRPSSVVAPSFETERLGHQIPERAGHFDDWIQESNLVSAV